MIELDRKRKKERNGAKEEQVERGGSSCLDSNPGARRTTRERGKEEGLPCQLP